jgi:hypothetical protein
MRDGVTVESLGDEFIIYDGDRGVVHRVSAVGSPWLADLLSGNAVEVDEVSVSQLLNAGVVEPLGNKDWTGNRRRVLALAGSVTAAVGLTTLFLPSAAAAASVYQVPPPGQYEIGFGEQDDRYSLIISQLYFSTMPPSPRPIVRIEYFRNNSDPVPFSYTLQLESETALVGSETNGVAERTIPNWDTTGERVFVTVTYNTPVGPDSVNFTLTWP